MVGTRGVPARYGGFETAVEEVGRRLVDRGHQVIVYCRTTAHEERPSQHLGMDLVHLPAIRQRSLETLSHSGLSAFHLAAHRTDVALVFNAANAPWLPVIKAARIPVATHVDGLEWKRGKWGRMGQRYYRVSESLSVRWSDSLIADAAGIQDYYRTEFDMDTSLITYGAPILTDRPQRRLAELGLQPHRYHLVVARFEPENHVDLIVDGYVRSRADLPLIVVGSTPYETDYTRRIHAGADDRVRFLGGVWDQELLDELYANALVYWHGHSVGGTNPSLLRAMGAATAVNAFDVNFNREVLGESGEFFCTTADVTRQLHEAEEASGDVQLRAKLCQREAERYDWDEVTSGYEDLCQRMYRREFPARRRGHRRRPGTR